MSIKLTVEQMQRASRGLELLDGYDRVVKDGDRERVVREPYKLGSGLRVQLAEIQLALAAALKPYEKARSSLVRQLAGSGGEVPKEKIGEFSEAHAEMLEAETELRVKPVTLTELKLDDNAVPHTVLALIMPVLDTGKPVESTPSSGQPKE